jgi:hypothetical protein
MPQRTATVGGVLQSANCSLTPLPVSQGLWMWSAPVQRTGPSGDDYSLVLLDSEGIEAYDQASRMYSSACSPVRLQLPCLPTL